MLEIDCAFSFMTDEVLEQRISNLERLKDDGFKVDPGTSSSITPLLNALYNELHDRSMLKVWTTWANSVKLAYTTLNASN